MNNVRTTCHQIQEEVKDFLSPSLGPCPKYEYISQGWNFKPENSSDFAPIRTQGNVR